MLRFKPIYRVLLDGGEQCRNSHEVNFTIYGMNHANIDATKNALNGLRSNIQRYLIPLYGTMHQSTFDSYISVIIYPQKNTLFTTLVLHFPFNFVYLKNNLLIVNM